MITENIHVAIVEDDPEIRQTLALIIDGTAGFWCKLTFENGKEALKPLQENYVDVVLMDIEMPKMNGIDVVKKLRADKINDHIRIVMVTSNKTLDFVTEAIDNAGANGFITKPFTPVEMRKKLDPIIDEVMKIKRSKVGFMGKLFGR